MGATSCTQQIFEEFYSEELAKGFFHGHTYTANPLSCMAALAALEMLQSPEIQQGINNIANWHREFKSRISGHAGVASIRHIGVILALDLSESITRYGKMRDRLYQYFLSCGIFLRPLGNTIYVLPPYIIRRGEMERIYNAIEGLLEQL